MDETKTLPATWKTAFHQLLKHPSSKTGNLPRIAILGVGNEIRSDDAAGVLVARLLSHRVSTDQVLILEAGIAPENTTGKLRRFAPDLVLIVDAADMGETSGTIQFISEETIDGMSASTHSLPLSMLVHYLKLELDCDVRLLGIHVGSNEVGEHMSEGVSQAVDQVVDGLEDLIRTGFPQVDEIALADCRMSPWRRTA
ncbi:MAG TPA: hydrogenase maturation peptidase HycI [Anaerolineales bacterium]|nr:hydrogenase maturation peptidase HycI [Anaerolineales bacterium]